MNPPSMPATPEEAPRPEIEVTNFGTAIEALLRNPINLLKALPKNSGLLGPLAILALASAAVLGLVFGTYAGGAQLWAAPLKVGGGLLLAALICFPSLYIFSCLANSPLHLKALSGAYVCFLALLGLLLIAFAPILWIFTQSSNSTPFIGTLGLVVWVLSFTLAAGLLRKLTSASRTSWQVQLWLLIFLTVTLQMSTALRPLLSKSQHFLPQEKKFFLTHWIDSINGTTETWEPSRQSQTGQRETSQRDDVKASNAEESKDNLDSYLDEQRESR